MQTPRALLIGNTDGIGLALTMRLLGRGYHVSGVSRRASSIDHPSYRHAVCDVTGSEYPATLRALLDTAGPFDICVYCVGIGESLDFANMAQESRVFQVNLLSLVATTNVLLPAMIAAGRGHFIGLSSIADEAISPDTPSYAASKAGMSSYLASLSLALRPHGVAVSNVRLGFVDTKMAKASVRPMMITAEQAVDVLLVCLARRPARLTYPWAMDVLVRLLRWVSLAKLSVRPRLR